MTDPNIETYTLDVTSADALISFCADVADKYMKNVENEFALAIVAQAIEIAELWPWLKANDPEEYQVRLNRLAEMDCCELSARLHKRDHALMISAKEIESCIVNEKIGHIAMEIACFRMFRDESGASIEISVIPDENAVRLSARNEKLRRLLRGMQGPHNLISRRGSEPSPTGKITPATIDICSRNSIEELINKAWYGDYVHDYVKLGEYEGSLGSDFVTKMRSAFLKSDANQRLRARAYAHACAGYIMKSANVSRPAFELRSACDEFLTKVCAVGTAEQDAVAAAEISMKPYVIDLSRPEAFGLLERKFAAAMSPKKKEGEKK